MKNVNRITTTCRTERSCKIITALIDWFKRSVDRHVVYVWNWRQELRPPTTQVSCSSPSNRKLRPSTCASSASISWYRNHRLSHSRAENQLQICLLVSIDCLTMNLHRVSVVIVYYWRNYREYEHCALIICHKNMDVAFLVAHWSALLR